MKKLYTTNIIHIPVTRVEFRSNPELYKFILRESKRNQAIQIQRKMNKSKMKS
jgi:hypothetical protein